MRGARFELEDKDENELGAAAKVGGGEQGEYSRHKGYLSFHEIMEKVNSSYTVIHDDTNGTYAYFDTDWISYDDVKNIQRKAEYIRDQSLGGATISELNEDKFLEDWHCGKYPLLTAVNRILRNTHPSNIYLPNCT